MRFRVKKENIYDINGNGRAFWISVITTKGKAEMLSFTKSEMKNQKSVNGFIEFELDDSRMSIKPRDIKALKDGEIAPEISICRIIDVGDFSSDSMEIDTISAFWDTAENEVKKKYKVTRVDKDRNVIYVAEQCFKTRRDKSGDILEGLKTRNKIIEKISSEGLDYVTIAARPKNFTDELAVKFIKKSGLDIPELKGVRVTVEPMVIDRKTGEVRMDQCSVEVRKSSNKDWDRSWTPHLNSILGKMGSSSWGDYIKL